jgi:hypothetical protein
MRLGLLLLAPLAALLPAAAMADSSATVTITGSVAVACHLGSPANSTIAVGTLSNLSDGTLAAIGPQSTTIADSWCNTGSTISLSATPLVAQSFSGAPPSGFTKAVNYTATASGWTSTPPSFATPTPASQTSNNPVAQTITVGVSAFATPSAGNRLVADPVYSGLITITLQTTAAASQ